MVYPQNQAIDNPQIRLTFQGLSRRVRSNQADISSILDAVESAQRLFRAKSGISWEQCEHVAGTLRMVLVPVRDLLDTTTRLPVGLDSLRFPLVSALHEVNTVVGDLAPLIAHYPFANQSSSHPTVAQRWDIQCKFDQLIDGCNDILRQSTILLDKAHSLATL